MERIHQFNFEPPARQEEHARVTKWAEAMIAEGLSLCFALGETKAEQELSRTEGERVHASQGFPYYVCSGKFKVTFSLFQGRKYVVSVSNGQEQQPGNSSELSALDPGETAHVVHIAENHLSVVSLVVADLDHVFQAEQVAGIWWRAIYIPCGRCLIMATHDVTKLRGLSPVSPCAFCASLRGPSYHQIAWPFPTHHIAIRWVGEPRSYPARMASVILRGPCSGILAYWEHTSMAIRSRDIDEKSLAPYFWTADDAAWIYTPLDDNEIITEIWWGSIGGNGDAMGLRISKGREVFLGFAFVQPFDPTTIVPPMPDFRYCVEPFFFSSANLQCLSEITVCQIPDMRGISGLLLTYTNGHKEALGEVRLNCVEPPIEVGKQDRI
ncbi:hypothetical protein FCIRC_4847 [Fusarium circinatum]|uniref:Uncharacterized protein n=1 Tax=Fusarium circinatum TaxID=48490 RepID=A0A8H5UAJ9_FUSCI|nr:hypothetical protein FCIRC_4847 [Fusarium circinatum]